MNEILEFGVLLVSTNDYEGRVENIGVVPRVTKNDEKCQVYLREKN